MILEELTGIKLVSYVIDFIDLYYLHKGKTSLTV